MKNLLFVLVIFSFWVLVTWIEIVPPLYLPSPLEVFGSVRPQLLVGAVVSSARSITGFCFGILLAYLLHFFAIAARLDRFMDAQFAASRSVPTIAIMPLFVLWFGFSEIGRIAIVTLSSAMFFLAPLHEGYRSLPREWTILRDQLSMNVCRFYFVIVAPGTLPNLKGAFRLSMSIALTMAIASEYIGAQTGLGKTIDSARVTFNVPGLFSAMLSASFIGVGVDRLLVTASDRLIHWKLTGPKG